MAHSCPECGMLCHCGGDIDDCEFDGTPEQMRCGHCDGEEEKSHDQPCSVERTQRTVIERKLLAALEGGRTVAILASKQDLEDMIAALYGVRTGNLLAWAAQKKRRKDLADGMSQLLREAFQRSI